MNFSEIKLTVIGLGYVGLPLAVEFGKFFYTIGFDISKKRIKELNSGKDSTLEVDLAMLQEAEFLNYTNDAKKMEDNKKRKIGGLPPPPPIFSVHRGG